MKIYIVCPRLCHGGAERVAVSLANGFVSKGHEVVFFADLFEEQTFILDDSVILLNLVKQHKNKVLKWISAIENVRKLIKKDRPDVIIGIMSLCSIVAQIAAMGLGIPVVATEHDSFERPRTAPMPLLIKVYKFYVSKIFRRVTVLTEADKMVLGKNRQNVVVMPNPLAVEPSEHVPSKKKIVLAAGRVDNWHYKGFDLLIKAWGKVVSSLKSQVSSEGWKLLIAGVWRNPETRTYLDGIAEEVGVKEQIEYLGFVDDMQSLYAQSSIFVLSSRYEAFGLVLIEAMSQGCACVACDFRGRQREIICPDGANDSSFSVDTLKAARPSAKSDENQVSKELEPETNLKPETTPLCGVEVCENGICCKPDNVEALAAGMRRMMEDEENRKYVQQNAIERSKYYSIENTIDRWESLLNQIVHK